MASSRHCVAIVLAALARTGYAIRAQAELVTLARGCLFLGPRLSAGRAGPGGLGRAGAVVGRPVWAPGAPPLAVGWGLGRAGPAGSGFRPGRAGGRRPGGVARRVPAWLCPGPGRRPFGPGKASGRGRLEGLFLAVALAPQVCSHVYTFRAC